MEGTSRLLVFVAIILCSHDTVALRSVPLGGSRLSSRSVRVAAGKQTEADNSELAEEPQPFGGSVDDVAEDLESSPFAPGSMEELADMRSKVAKYQAELDAQREASQAREAAMDTVGGFLGGDSVVGFMVKSVQSIPEYEVPNPGALARKMGLSLAGMLAFFFLVNVIDGLLVEGIRPIVKYTVDSAPVL